MWGKTRLPTLGETKNNLLFRAWMKGPQERGRLIHEARRLGHGGTAIVNCKLSPFRGDISNDSSANYCPPAASFYMRMQDIFWQGVQANVIQHSGGNGLFFWHEDTIGYDFFMFDYGPGALNPQDKPQEDLVNIFDKCSYRQGGVGPAGKYRGGGVGAGLMLVGSATYLTRVVSVNAGMVRVVDKTPGFNTDWKKHVRTTQKNFYFAALGIENLEATGFMVHGFVPLRNYKFVGAFSPISSEDILGSVVIQKSQSANRGPWQLPPAEGLDALSPGQEVIFTYYKVDKECQHIGILWEVPSSENEGVFVFVDGFEIGYSSVKGFSVTPPVPR